MDTYTSPAREPPPTPSTDPEEELAQKQRDLQEVQTEIASDTQKANSLQADIKVLLSKIAEVKQLLAGYDAQKLQRQLDDDTGGITTKTGIAVKALKDKRTAIDNAIKAFEDKLKGQETDKNTAQTKSAKADGEAKAAADAAQTAQQAYEDMKKIPIKFDAWFKDITSLLDQSNKAEAQSDYVALYFLAGEANKTADKFKTEPILSNDAYKKNLNDKLLDSETARKNANDKKAIADQALKDFNEKTKNYDAAKASWRTDVLNALKKL